MPTRRQIKDALSQSKRSLVHSEKRELSWDTIESSVRILKDQILSDPIIKQKALKGGILPIARGGLIPATMLSHQLNLPIQYVLWPENWPMWIHPSEEEYVIIDDICDTGKTFRKARKMVPKASLLALIAKPEGRDMCDGFTIEVPQDVWVKFPWETE